MYRNQCYPEKYSLRRGQSSEDYELCNAAQKFIAQWSPRDSGARYLARSRYASPGSLSKSVPRRNRSSLRFGINRSLNFDLGGHARLSNYASPNSSSESNVSTENDHYLSRSAKILRALNIDFSPLKSAALGARRINKSLNFDLGPSPDGGAEAKPTRRASSQLGSHSVSPLARINKTLNFETSSGESSVNSVLESSLEFIDENQNQTPSHQRNGAARKAKKSLDYSSPKFVSSPSSNPSTPMLRSDLRQKIDDIVRQNGGVASANGNPGNKRLDDFGASTPRNLFDELRADEDEDGGEHLGRPSTPENFVRIIPESMSAIKKSHKKERVLGRMSKTGYQAVVVHQADARPVTQLDDAEMDAQSEVEKRPATPPAIVNEHRYDSPQQCGLKSIKKSHKRDKSKRRSYGASSDDDEDEDNDDEMSETGSLFEYTRGSEKKSTARLDLDGQVARQLPARNTADVEDGVEPSSRPPVSDEPGVVPSIVVTDLSSVTSTPETTGRSAPRPGTPENRINFLQRVMTDSIKKSHKKVKDTNKRFFFKPRLLNAEPEARVDAVETVPTQDDHRAGTPDNANSSRLLLSQFSSVKKSHRKDKHRRMLSGSLQRKKYFGRETASSSECETHNCSVSSTELASPSQIAITDVPPPTNEFSDDSRDAPYCSLQNSPEFGVDALADRHKSSPNKRKNDSANVQAWISPESKRTEDSALYESAEEEFKIFTPIKKRKSIDCIAVPVARRICPEDTNTADDDAATVATRCSTPRITRATGFRTSASPEFPATPEGASFVPIADPSSPRQMEPASEPNAGRATPQNLSTAVLMAGINSIKKSHKKDKRGNAATRRPLTQDDEFAVHDNETSSRSRETPSSEAEASAKTPPNCLQAKNYLRLLRTESIKRSHKKVRDRKRRDRVIEPELSDDGSIFDEAERSFDLAEPTERRGCDTPKEHADTSGNEMRNRQSGAAAFARHGDNLSDDGSIFDSEEKNYGSPNGGDRDDADVVGAARTDDF